MSLCKIPLIPFPGLPSISLSLPLPKIPIPHVPSVALSASIPGLRPPGLPSISASLPVPKIPIPHVPSVALSLSVPPIPFPGLPSISLTLPIPKIPVPHLPACPLDLVETPPANDTKSKAALQMAGAGFMRAGLDPAGQQSADHTTPFSLAQGAAICRSFDPATRDYSPTLQAAGDFASMPIVVAKVAEALGNRVGSFSWDATAGDPSLSVDRDRGDMAARIRGYTETALKPLTDAGEIEITKIQIIIGSGQYQRTVIFRDLSTGQEHTA